jgi:hypothetical protein
VVINVIGLLVQYRYLCKILMKLDFIKRFSKKFSYIKFHEKPSSGGRVVPCGLTERQIGKQTDIYDDSSSRFHNFVNALKWNESVLDPLRYVFYA